MNDSLTSPGKARIMHPLGWESGRTGSAAEIIDSIALEMLAHKSDLQESLDHWRVTPAETDQVARRINDLERYATALSAIYFQMRPDRWNPAACGVLLEMAEKHRITLPKWMKA